MKKKSHSLHLLKKYRAKVIIAPLFKAFECVCELIVPILVKAIIDEGLTDPNTIVNPSQPWFITSLFGAPGSHYRDASFIFGLGGIMLLLSFLGFGFTMVTQYLAARVSADYSYDLKKALYSQVNRLSAVQLDAFGKNKALNLVNNDATSSGNGVMMVMRLLVRAPLLILGSIVMSFLLSWVAGLIVATSLLLSGAVIFLVVAFTPKQYKILQEQLDQISASGEDSIVGARVVRAFNQQENEIASFQGSSERYRKQALLIARINAFINPLTFSFVNIAVLLLLYFGNPNTSGIEVGTIVACVSYLTQSLAALTMFNRLMVSLSKALASMRRIDSFLALESSIQDGPLEAEKETKDGDVLYEFQNVSLSFGGESKALSNIDWTILQGKKYGIIGGTGSGKSTLLSLLERFLDPTEGTLLYKGHPIQESALASIRSQIALVSQKPQLFSGTIRSNVTLGNETASEEEIAWALENALASDFVNRYKDGVDHIVEEGGKNFSGGQKQRLLLARALLSKRPILMLDDSTSALDYKSDLLVRRNIEKIPGITLILVSQRATSIKDCDEILVLDQGKIVGKGTHSELLSACTVYREIYEAQVATK